MARPSVCGKIAFVTVTARQLSSAAIPYAARSMSRDAALADVAVVVGMAVLYLGLEFLQVPKRWTFLASGLALAGYLAWFTVRRPHSWHDLGFRRDNLAASLLPVGLSTLLAAAGLIGIAVAEGRSVLQPGVLTLLAVYPAWALVQQFAFQGLLHRGLTVLIRSPSLQVLITAAAFASVHPGNPRLFVLTFLAGIMWSLLYRRWPNLWLLAGSHTVLAALVYPLVLGEAPLSRI
jgi:hypothetical protein